MSRIHVLTALVLSFMISGCASEVKDDPRFHLDPDQVQQARNVGYAMADATEVDVVEDMAAKRAEYRASLQSLIGFYREQGAAAKLGWAQKEYGMLVQYRYLMPGEMVSAGLQATDSIEEADALYAEALDIYKDAGGLLIIVDEQKLRISLSKFNEVIERYPTSDKIDDAAYKAGRIYEHFKDYQIAAIYYQRAFQWNENTPYPARYRAAYVLDQKLHMRTEALPLYKLSFEKEKRYENHIEYAMTRITNMTRLEKEEKPELEEVAD
jgi:tetratricopeptide (TPR) repeat protein